MNENNKPIKYDSTTWGKIKSFFIKIFSKKNKDINIIENREETNNTHFLEDISYREEIKELNKKKALADKLMDGEINVDNLSNNEVKEMIEYFNNYIDEMNKKLKEIKKSIMDLKN